ncbi:MAG TPA: hypothetical protein VII29_03375 [Terriglobales bacterium]
MRRWCLMWCCFLLSLVVWAEPSDSNPPKTIEGCVASINGAFMLGTASGERYILKGDHDALFSYNGKQVRITGTVKKSANGSSPSSPGEPRTLKVSDIKKVYDTCQF